MADGQGFEPWETVKPHTLSKRAQSTTLPPILEEGGNRYADFSALAIAGFINLPMLAIDHPAGTGPSHEDLVILWSGKL